LWSHGAAQTLLDQALDFAEASLLNNKDFITAKVTAQSSRWVPKWVDGIIATKVMNGLLSTMREMRKPDHPWRAELGKAVDKLVHDLATDDGMRERGEEMKAELLANPVFLDQVKSLWGEIEGGLHGDFSKFAGAAGEQLISALRGFGQWLEESPTRRARLNRQ